MTPLNRDACDHDARRDATPDVLSAEEVKSIRGTNIHLIDSLDMLALCDSHEALRRQVEADKHAAKDYVDACVEITRLRSRVVALEAERAKIRKAVEHPDALDNPAAALLAISLVTSRAAARIGVSEP